MRLFFFFVRSYVASSYLLKICRNAGGPAIYEAGKANFHLLDLHLTNHSASEYAIPECKIVVFAERSCLELQGMPTRHFGMECEDR